MCRIRRVPEVRAASSSRWRSRAEARRRRDFAGTRNVLGNGTCLLPLYQSTTARLPTHSSSLSLAQACPRLLEHTHTLRRLLSSKRDTHTRCYQRAERLYVVLYIAAAPHHNHPPPLASASRAAPRDSTELRPRATMLFPWYPVRRITKATRERPSAHNEWPCLEDGPRRGRIGLVPWD